MNVKIELSDLNLKELAVSKCKNVKDHVIENKEMYIGFALMYIVGVGVGVRYSKALKAGQTGNVSLVETVTNINPIGILSKQDITTNITKIFTDNRGRPGHLVYSEDFDRHFPSQTEASKVFGISNTNMSRHLNGKIPDVKGLHFNRPSV